MNDAADEGDELSETWEPIGSVVARLAGELIARVQVFERPAFHDSCAIIPGEVAKERMVKVTGRSGPEAGLSWLKDREGEANAPGCEKRRRGDMDRV